MGVFCITGPGGSSLPSWRESSCLHSVSTRIAKWVRLNYPSFSRLVFSISTWSRQVLPKRQNISFSPASPPPASLPVYPGLTVAGLWHAVVYLIDWLTTAADWCKHNASSTQIITIENEATSKAGTIWQFSSPKTHKAQVSPTGSATNASVIMSRYFTETWLQVSVQCIFYGVSLRFVRVRWNK